MSEPVPVALPREGLIVCQGDSLTYGTDFTRTGTREGINGSRDPRSALPFPEALETALRVRGCAVRVENRGYGGDTAREGFERWRERRGGPLTILLYGSNDVLRLLAGPGWLRRYAAALTALVRRARRDGQVLVLGLPPVRFPTYRARFRAANAVLREVARAEGVPTLDLTPALSGVRRVWVDGVHFTPEANEAVAEHIARFLLAERQPPTADG